MSFSDVISRIVGLVRAVPEMAPYRGVASAMSQWTPDEPRCSSSPGFVDDSDWPRPGDYLRLLGWDGRVEDDGSRGTRPSPSICFVEAGLTAPRQGDRGRCQQGGLAGGQPQRRSGSAAAYVASIAQQGQVTTRLCSVHDLANAMTWAAFPGLKWSIFGHLWQEVQDFESGQRAMEPGRGRSTRSDRLTQLDEAGVLGGGALRLFFGHALLEHLILGRFVQVNAPLWLLHDHGQDSSLAGRMAARLNDGGLGDVPTGTYPVGGPGLWTPCGFKETCLEE